jgi:hypothetical protein
LCKKCAIGTLCENFSEGNLPLPAANPCNAVKTGFISGASSNNNWLDLLAILKT